MFGISTALLAASLALTSTFAATTSSYPPPFSNERHISYTPATRKEKENDKKIDLYEPNDTFDNAVNLTPTDYLSGDCYTSTVTGILHHEEGYSDDYDFFYIENLTDAWITVTVSPVSKEDFVRLSVGTYRYETIQTNDTSSPTWEGDLSHLYETVYETDENKMELEQTCRFFATAGTYFVGLSYLTSDEERKDISYHLAVDLKYSQTGYADVNLEDMMFNRNLAGALWVMDTPFSGDSDLLTKPASITYHQKAYPRLADPEFYLDDLNKNLDGQPIRFATYYLWDENLLASLRQVVLDAITFLDKLDQAIALQNQETTIAFDYADKALKVATKFVSMAGKIFPFSSVVTGVASSILKAVAFVLKKVLPILLVPADTVKAFRETMKNLAIAFDKSEDQTGYRIIEIPLYFNFKEEKNSFAPKTKTMVDTAVTAKVLADRTDWLLDGHTLSSIGIVGDWKFNRGHFYGYQYSSSDENGLKTAPIDDYPVVPRSAKPLSINIPTSVYASRGDYALCSFTPDADGSYCVILPYSSSKQTLELSAFNTVPLGYSNAGLIQSNVEGLLNASHDVIGSHMDLTLKKGETIYFRVKNENYSRFDPVSIEVKGTPVEPHIMTFEWKTNKQHWRNCTCGKKSLEGHAVSSSDLKTCVFCHGSVSTGFVGGPSRSAEKNREFGNGSYVRLDGVYVLSETDLPLLLEGSLSLPEAEAA